MSDLISRSKSDRALQYIPRTNIGMWQIQCADSAAGQYYQPEEEAVGSIFSTGSDVPQRKCTIHIYCANSDHRRQREIGL
jgi:hypothetical protein